jgi:hypothetical protein
LLSIFFSDRTQSDLLQKLRHALQRVSPDVLSSRVQEVLDCDARDDLRRNNSTVVVLGGDLCGISIEPSDYNCLERKSYRFCGLSKKLRRAGFVRSELRFLVPTRLHVVPSERCHHSSQIAAVRKQHRVRPKLSSMMLLNRGTGKTPSIVGANGHLNELGRIRLAKELFCGRYRPGQRVHLKEIGAKYGLDNDSILKIFSELQSLGLITLTGKFSAVVHAPNSKEMQEAYEIRAAREEISGRGAATALEGNTAELSAAGSR